MPHMRDLMQDYRIDGILRVLHQTIGKAQMHTPVGIFAAGTEALFCGGIGDFVRVWKPKQACEVSDTFGNVGIGQCLQHADFLIGEGSIHPSGNDGFCAFDS